MSRPGFRAVQAHNNGDCGPYCELCDFEDAQEAAEREGDGDGDE